MPRLPTLRVCKKLDQSCLSRLDMMAKFGIRQQPIDFPLITTKLVKNIYHQTKTWELNPGPKIISQMFYQICHRAFCACKNLKQSQVSYIGKHHWFLSKWKGNLQSVFWYSPTLFNKSVEVWNQRLQRPVCGEYFAVLIHKKSPIWTVFVFHSMLTTTKNHGIFPIQTRLFMALRYFLLSSKTFKNLNWNSWVFLKWNWDSVNSENLVNYWSMNRGQFKDPLCYLCLHGAVVWSLSLHKRKWVLQVINKIF